MNKFMQAAIEEANLGVKKRDGGPFGCVIVKRGKVIASAHNTVIKNNDPTCHSEINAIRQAAKKLGRFDLSDCEIYSSCEPCPMCLSAIYWAKMKKLYFGCTREDAAMIGFDDKFIYDAIKGKKKGIKPVQMHREECLRPMAEWFKKKDKVNY